MPSRFRILALAAIVVLTACDAPPTSPIPSDGMDARLAVPTTVVSLGTLGGGWSRAMDVNNRGVVVGNSQTSDGSTHAFRWTKAAGMQDLGTLGGSTSEAMAINRLGYIAGWSTDAAGAYHLVMWLPNGAIRDLSEMPAELDGPGFHVRGINDRNEIAGQISDFGWWVSYFWSDRTGLIHYPWGDSRETYAEAINNKGDVVGYWCCGNNDIALYGGFLVTDGDNFIDMGGVRGYAAYPYDVSDGRVVVGLDYAIGRSDWETGSYDTAPFKWTREDGYRNLGSLGGRDGFAIGVNRFGEIVGVSTTSSGDAHAFFWARDRGMVDLGRGVAYAINDELPLIVGDLDGRATLWMGSGGVAPLMTASAQSAGGATGASARCFHDQSLVRSKAALLGCLAGDGR